MIQIDEFKLKPGRVRVALLHVRYYDLVLKCQLMVWNREKLYIKMPGYSFTEKTHKRYAFWPDKVLSDAFQEEALKKVFDEHGIDLQKALELIK